MKGRHGGRGKTETYTMELRGREHGGVLRPAQTVGGGGRSRERGEAQRLKNGGLEEARARAHTHTYTHTCESSDSHMISSVVEQFEAAAEF